MELSKIEKILKKEPNEAAEELLKEVEKAYGEIPYILNFMKQSPELLVTKILYDNAIIREFKRLESSRQGHSIFWDGSIASQLLDKLTGELFEFEEAV